MSSIAQLQSELEEAKANIDICNEALALDHDDADSIELKAFYQDQVTDLTAKIAAKTAHDAPPPPPPTTSPPAHDDDTVPPAPKYDMSKHPKFQQQRAELVPTPVEDNQPVVFNVKDVVMAKYSDDKQWYQATVISKTGSSLDPVYTVTFKGYGNTETKRKHEIRPVENSKKRKADGVAIANSAPTNNPTSHLPPPISHKSGAVISAAPSIDTSLMQARREPSRVSDGPTRMAPEPKKLKGHKALEKVQSNWKSWQATGPKKTKSAAAGPKQKESQFRTAENPKAKGIAGSGQPMKKEEARSKWSYSGPRPAGGDNDIDE